MNQPILTRDEGEQLYSYGGKHVVLLHSESGGGYYREWEVAIKHTRYCIVNEGDTWTLMYFRPGNVIWMDVPDMDVDSFLLSNKLILAA